MNLKTCALLAAVLVGMGCAHHHHHDDDVVVAEPAPATYVYEPGYYDRGYYHDDYWYWHDPHGHFYRESREAHERREHEYHEHHRD